MTQLTTFKILFTSVFLIVSVYVTNAQNKEKYTLPYNDTIGSPKAGLDAIAWISGSWEGKALGGTVEEIWTPPLGNSMMCTFKLVINNKVIFYEFVTISEEKGTLIMRLKHYDEKLHGWEKKDETVDFKLVKVTPNRVYFDGFTFEKVSPTEMNIYVVFKQKGKSTLATFSYKKQ